MDWQSESAKQRLAYLSEILSRSVLVTLYALLVINLYQDMQVNFRVSSFLLLVQELLLVILLLVRRPSMCTSMRPQEWVMAFAATFLPLMLGAHGNNAYLIGSVLSSAGALTGIFGVMALNRSFGIVPANRGIRTGGIYRWVRHSLYASYTVAFSGFLINNFSLNNASILAAWFVMQALRLLMEERHLAQDPEYREFMQTTRWRLLPGVW
ncbi:MAG: isoprenylcysteine carboxyl methyltransferase [Alphaproteobacteria bacterium]|nr:isoprenylcysteine carboxyl methyltransferase [Alphaproteobacteria bacterium]